MKVGERTKCVYALFKCQASNEQQTENTVNKNGANEGNRAVCMYVVHVKEEPRVKHNDFVCRAAKPTYCIRTMQQPSVWRYMIRLGMKHEMHIRTHHQHCHPTKKKLFRE